MSSEIHKAVLSLSSPIFPIPSILSAELNSLDGIRCVIFDVYGTLLLSREAPDSWDRDAALAELFQALRIEAPSSGLAHRFAMRIQQENYAASLEGIEHPENDIRQIWKSLLPTNCSSTQIELLALAYECQLHPVWPMPDARSTLAALRAQGLMLGLISNAQFYTRHQLEALFDASLDDLGFSPSLQFLSYEHLRAKPGSHLFDLLVGALERFGISTNETLIVGNDPRNDVLPAQEHGFRTALIAADFHAYRPRPELVTQPTPDAVILELQDLLKIL